MGDSMSIKNLDELVKLAKCFETAHVYKIVEVIAKQYKLSYSEAGYIYSRLTQ